VRPAAGTVARFQHEDGKTGFLQRICGTEARSAGADDGDID
jgi:hypothetical protein